jgi:hypothetical protein
MGKFHTKMNYPVLKGRGIPFGASSFSGFYPCPKGQGVPAAKVKKSVYRLLYYKKLFLKKKVKYFLNAIIKERK